MAKLLPAQWTRMTRCGHKPASYSAAQQAPPLPPPLPVLTYSRRAKLCAAPLNVIGGEAEASQMRDPSKLIPGGLSPPGAPFFFFFFFFFFFLKKISQDNQII